ncbi:VanZ family protein [Streptomyces shaanxiensis]|uniref:VanZ-like domain-containing protein n=1 Tax=Streptomyces shaanxiensis TaxID=653357 RepID=A0ABP7UIA0_9ACTN
MIEAVFQGHLLFLALAISVTIAAGVIVYFLGVRRTSRTQATFNGLWASSTVGPVALTSWSGSGVMTYECAVNPDVLVAFTSTQGQLNILLFAPFGLFAALATRRLLFAVAAGILFTATVETAQATVPFISRLCDSDDLVANTVGAITGAVIGELVSRRLRGGEPMTKVAMRRAMVVGAPILVLIVAAWIAVIDPTRTVQPSNVPAASAVQKRALGDALKKAFGAGPSVSDALYFNNGDGTAAVTTPLAGGGYAEITWPDREQFTAHFTPSYYGEGVHAYKIPGVSRRVSSADGAKDIAAKYASAYAPWAIPGSKVTVSAIDESEEIGWMVEWRRWKAGVLMPMRLSIAIEPSGRVIDLIARHIEDPQLPEAQVNEQKAWGIFDGHFKVEAGQGERAEPIYLAERRDDQWRIHWRLSVRNGDTILSAVIDATDGSIHRPTTTETSAAEQTP